MGRFIIVCCCLFVAGNISAQSKEKEPLAGAPEPFAYVELMPQFIGGTQAMYKFISDNLEYPETARDSNIQGNVIVQFVVDTDSLLKRIKVMRGIGYGCDEEVLRMMHLMSERKMWIPGRQEGKPVPVSFTLPIKFILQGNEPAPKKKE